MGIISIMEVWKGGVVRDGSRIYSFAEILVDFDIAMQPCNHHISGNDNQFDTFCVFSNKTASL